MSSQLELDFTLIACMANTMMGHVLYLDTSALFHVKECKYFFSDLKEKYLQMHIELGDDGRYRATKIGKVIFLSELGSPLRLKDVIFVPRLNNNPISIEFFKDLGYEMIFSKGKAFLRHITTRQVKQIKVRLKNLYKLDVEDYVALSNKVDKVQICDVSELWQMRSCHLHPGTLKTMQQISIFLSKGCLQGLYLRVVCEIHIP